jgi:hypothetical protein
VRKSMVMTSQASDGAASAQDSRSV